MLHANVDDVTLYSVHILYLRWTVNLLPFLLSLLSSFIFSPSSLYTETEDQQEDSKLLDLHVVVSGVCG